jgi:hypothetical protein
MKKIKKNHCRAFIWNYKKRQYIYSSMEDSEVVLAFERNNAGLKKLSSSVHINKWLICLPKCHVTFKMCIQPWTTFFIFRLGLSDIRITVTGLAEVYWTWSLDIGCFWGSDPELVMFMTCATGDNGLSVTLCTPVQRWQESRTCAVSKRTLPVSWCLDRNVHRFQNTIPVQQTV